MNNDEIIKQIRESVEKQVSEGQMTPEVVFIYLQLQILDKLESVNINLIDVESAVNDLNPRKGE